MIHLCAMRKDQLVILSCHFYCVFFFFNNFKIKQWLILSVQLALPEGEETVGWEGEVDAVWRCPAF